MHSTAQQREKKKKKKKKNERQLNSHRRVAVRSVVCIIQFVTRLKTVFFFPPLKIERRDT
jgi:hypothetical protein